MMDDDERAEAIRAIVSALAEEQGLTSEQFLRRLLFQALVDNPAWTILPGFGGTDRHGMRGLDGPLAHPAALERMR